MKKNDECMPTIERAWKFALVGLPSALTKIRPIELFRTKGKAKKHKGLFQEIYPLLIKTTKGTILTPEEGTKLGYPTNMILAPNSKKLFDESKKVVYLILHHQD